MIPYKLLPTRILLAILFVFFLTVSFFAQTSADRVPNWKGDWSAMADTSLLEVYEFCSRQWGVKVRSDIDSSIIFGRKALEVAHYLKNDSMAFQSYRRLANSYIQKGNYLEARIYVDTMWNLLDTTIHYNAFRYYNTIGQINYYEGNYELALEDHLNSLRHARAGNLLENIPAAFGEIARVFNDMGQPLKALEYSLQDVAFTMEHGGARGKFIANYNLGNKYVDLDSFDRALEVYDLADSLLQELNVPVYTAALQMSKGRLLVQLEDPNAALPLLEEAIQIMESVGNMRGATTAKLTKATALNKLNRFTESLPILEEVYIKVEEIGIFDLQQSTRKEYAEALHQTGNSADAYMILKDYEQTRDSLQKAETQKTINELELKYQTAEKEAQITAQELLLVKNQNQKRLLWGGIISLLIIGGITLTYIYNDQKKKKKLVTQQLLIKNQKIESLEQEKKLFALNSMIEGQEAERKRIAQDLHDGLGGMLSGIKAQMQSLQKQINNLAAYDLYGKANEMINTASQEVRRIAYNMMPVALSKLGLKAALEDLFSNLQNQNELKVTYQLKDLEERLSETTEIMVYRIIQELCSNVIKHAGASHLIVQINKIENQLVILVEDDGMGFNRDEDDFKRGIGLRSVDSRVKYLKGDLDIISNNEGTSVTIHVPV